MSTTDISTHFTWVDAMCHDGTEVPMQFWPNARALALSVLEPLRAEFGGPLVTVSWFRTETYNHGIGGAPHSQHLTASAADIRPNHLSDLPNLKGVIERMIKNGKLPQLGGYGTYPGWVHVDIRRKSADGHIARWSGTKAGSELG